MKGYLVFDIEITDAAAWAQYQKVAGPVMAASGGEFIFSSAEVDPLEGGWTPATLSVVAFPSPTAAREFYYSKAYQDLVPLREAASVGRGVLVTG